MVKKETLKLVFIWLFFCAKSTCNVYKVRLHFICLHFCLHFEAADKDVCVAALSYTPDTRVIAQNELESAKPACSLSPQPSNQVQAANPQLYSDALTLWRTIIAGYS